MFEKMKCLIRFRGNGREESEEMFKKNPRNVRQVSRQCSRIFRGMFEKIMGNV